MPANSSAHILRKHSVVLGGHRTSVSIEDAFWTALQDIAAQRQVSVNALVAQVDESRQGNLSSALRLFVLAELKSEEIT